jgi:hypothetical protein
MRVMSAILAFLALTAAAKSVHAESLAADLYYRGLVEVEATLPRSNLAIPSTAMPCVNCHGADGRGGREGGVAVPPVSWRHLTMATAERPAYDQALLIRALRDGIGADGSPLHDIMPRYDLPDELARDLTDWLQAIRPAHTPGVSDDEIVIAIPSVTTDDPRAVVIANVLNLYADQLNRNGGIYGRRLRLADDSVGVTAFARLASLGSQTKTGSGSLNLWPLQTHAEEKPDFRLIPSDTRLKQGLLQAAKRDDPAAQRLSTIPDDRDLMPRTFVFDGQADALSAFIREWKGPGSLTIYTTPNHIDLSPLKDLSPRPLRLVLANSLASDDAQSDSSETNPYPAAFNKAAKRLHLSRATAPIAKAAWASALLLEDALRRTGRNLDQERCLLGGILRFQQIIYFNHPNNFVGPL